MLARRGSVCVVSCSATALSACPIPAPLGISAVANSAGKATRAWHLTSGAGCRAPYAGESTVLVTSIADCQIVPSGSSRLNPASPERSEEHTSELQSPSYLVFRLL